MGGMGNQDGGDEDISLEDEGIVKRERKRKQKGKKRFINGGGMAKSLCATESRRDRGRRMQRDDLQMAG